MLGLKNTGWCVVGYYWLTICTINFIFVRDGLTAAAERVAGLADVLRRYIDHTCSCFQLRFRGGVHLCEREGREIWHHLTQIRVVSGELWVVKGEPMSGEQWGVDGERVSDKQRVVLGGEWWAMSGEQWVVTSERWWVMSDDWWVVSIHACWRKLNEDPFEKFCAEMKAI